MRKFLSVILSLVIVTGLFFVTSCSKKQLAFSDCSWYSSQTYELTSHQEDFVTFQYPDVACVCGDKLYLSMTINYFEPQKIEAFDNGTGTLTFDDNIQVNELMEYDVNTGELTNTIKYQEIIEEFYPEVSDLELITICGIVPHEDNLSIYLQRIGGFMSSEDNVDRITYNTKTGEFSDCEKGIVTFDSFSGESLEKIVNVDGKDVVVVYCVANGNNSYNINVIDGTNVKTIMLGETINENIFSMEDFIVDGNKLICIVDISDIGGFYKALIEVDISSGKVSFSADMKNLSSVDNTYIVNGNESYSIRSEGIYKYNTDSDEMEKLVDFNFSDINLYSAGHSSILSCTDNRIVLLENERQSLGLFDGITKTKIHIITASDENPYEGRQKLVVANMGDDLDYATAEAISRFNKENKEYYIELRMYYDDGSLSGLYALTDVSNRVMIDIKNGDAPDIILNGASYTELNSSEYLVDLSTYINSDSDFDLSDYYENIISAASTDGKLYQIPVTTNLYGVRSLVEENDDYSFSYGEFAEYKDVVLNGFDPIYESVGFDKNKYVNELLASHLCDYINYESNQVDFNKDSFINAIKYVNAMYDMPEDYSPEAFYYAEPFLSRNEVYYGEIHPFDFYRTIEHLGEDIRINGTPYAESSANRNACVQIISSVAISADSENADGSWQFVKMLLSDEIQSLVDLRSTPVSKSGLDAHISRMIEEADYEIQVVNYTMCGNSYPEMIDDCTLAEIDEEDIQSFKSNYASVDVIHSSDAGILLIVDEELTAYFEGQKSLDEVIPIINNRVSTLINERS
ncbi:MAG: ABC transporter substrate-binding protein [Saccharofermentans sp.]|nr:ABC transporter substrate-binding protein [Saccharofermentans sp.]